jgi:CheY-like chemotaxis protein
MAKILIIDDDIDIVESMRLILEANSHEVESAQNGEEGLKKVKGFEPDLIMLDVMMETTTSGFHVAYQLRNADPASEYAKYSKVPILMITAVSGKTRMPFDPEKDKEFLPVDGYIEKPVHPQELLTKVRELTGPPFQWRELTG